MTCVAFGVDVEGDARLFQRGADAADVLRVEADVERLKLRPAQIVAAEADGGEHGAGRQGRAPPGGARRAPAGSSTAAPAVPARTCHAHPDVANRWNGDIRHGTLCGNCARRRRLNGIRPTPRTWLRLDRKLPLGGLYCWNSARMLWLDRVGNAQRLHAELLLDLQSLKRVDSSFMSASTSWPIPRSTASIRLLTKSC